MTITSNKITANRQQFITRFSTRRVCFKDPTKITKLVRKANETLVAFKERWIVETGFITGVPEVIKISTFMDAHKCPELAKRYSDKVPKTVEEMMIRLDNFVRWKETFARTELPKWEASEASRKSEEKFGRKGQELDESTNRISSFVSERRLRQITHHRSSHERIIGFAGGMVKPLGKNKLEVVFGDGDLFRTVMINSTVVRAPSPYIVIFGRTGLRSLRAVSSTTHSMRGKGVLRDEKGHSRVVAANHTSKGGNDIRVCGSGNGGRKCRFASRKKGETMSDTLRKPDVKRSQEELCPVGKIDQPLKQILNKVQASGKLAKYPVELGAYNITYEPRNAMKGQVLMAFLSEAPVGTPTEEFFRLPAKLAPHSKKDEGLKHRRKGRFKAGGTGGAINQPKGDRGIIEEEEDNWMKPIIRCLAEGVWPKDKDERRALRMKINQLILEEGVLFKKGYLVPMLRCVGPLQVNYVIREIHMGSYGMHIEARFVVAKAIRQGYYWPTMHMDARNVTQKCDSCQVHALVSRRPKTLMTSIMAP
nr:reverse transcriptase domain-containing protein [Tanacetum cinerariifolium]